MLGSINALASDKAPVHALRRTYVEEAGHLFPLTRWAGRPI
jgi:hypothetical protein